MAEPTDYITATRKHFVTNDNEGRMIEKCIVEIQGAFLVKIRNYAFNGIIRENAWYDELADGKLKDETLALKAKIEGSWEDATPGIAPFTRMENFGRGPYANMKTEWSSNPYLNVNRVFKKDYEASNVGCTQENQGHKGDLIPEPSNCKVRRFEMMKYSFDDDEEYITIKESEYLNHSKDSLDAYRELLPLIDEGWVVTTPEDE
ncbi:hypothetical protein Tco_0638184 [Tanacetum coccineum]